jgi:hypothetical protein
MNIIHVDSKYTGCGDEKLCELVITIRSNFLMISSKEGKFVEKYEMTSTTKSVGTDDKYVHN